MKNTFVRALGLALLVCALGAPTLAATPKPKVTLPPIHYPNAKLHTEFVVEVNAKGQVVLVKTGKSSKDTFYNAQTYGNVLQMWIRRPDGSAVVGLYRVTYDYNPKSHGIARKVALIKAGGNWGSREGAANEMIDIVKRDNARAEQNLSKFKPTSPSPKPTKR